MQTLRLESLDHHEVTRELHRVEGELKGLATYRDDLEDQLGKLLRAESDHKTNHTDDTDSGPREKFLADTKDMHLSKAERALQSG